jgi:ribosome-binding protein aMBF1 (putative translation factor)
MRTFKDSIKRSMGNPILVYDEEKVLAELAVQIAKERENQGISQKEMAHQLKTKQQAISRLEKPNYNYSVRTLLKVAKVIHKKLEIRFI